MAAAATFHRSARSPRDHPSTDGDLRSAVRPLRRPGRRGGRPAGPLGGGAGRTARRRGGAAARRRARTDRRAAWRGHQDRLGCRPGTGRHHARHRPARRDLARAAVAHRSPRSAPARRCGRSRRPWTAPASGCRSTRPPRGDAGRGARGRRGRPAAAPARQPVRPTGRGALSGRRRRAGRRRRGGAAGLDVARLLCGSQGGLGVLVSATMRVQALPASRVWVTRPVWTPLEVHDLVRAVLAARLDPAAVELDLPVTVPLPRRRVHPDHPSVRHRPDHPSIARGSAGPAAAGSLVVLLEGGPADVAERVERLVALFGPEAVAGHAAPGVVGALPVRPGRDRVADRGAHQRPARGGVRAARRGRGPGAGARLGRDRHGARRAARVPAARTGGVDPRRGARGAARPAGPLRRGGRAGAGPPGGRPAGASCPPCPASAPPRTTSTPTSAWPPAASPAASDPTHPTGRRRRPRGQMVSLRRTRMAMSSRGASTEKPIAVARSRAAVTSAE